jgi:hypothetical protein
MAVAYGGLRHLRDQGLRVAQQQKLQRPISMELVLEPLSDQAIGVADAPLSSTYSSDTMESVGK